MTWFTQLALGFGLMLLCLPLIWALQQLSPWMFATSWYAVAIVQDALVIFSPVWVSYTWAGIKLRLPLFSLWSLLGGMLFCYLLLPLLFGSSWSLAAWLWSQPSALVALGLSAVLQWYISESH
ncbi:hypothetical protein [Ferrimonas aestuarii]|uniref:Uncharacterized protein n=1 Tax=Ferrimonas aestuarii TaxID=2569539 RepID=A0A4U1BN41_9GAMM|nr:hypothetical protein [Ferrimonas aestuarii]TKB54767.1 hypothetical protein FCL42_11505 [Ferrimonas aestuarii]